MIHSTISLSPITVLTTSVYSVETDERNFSDMITFSTDFGSRPFALAIGDFNHDRKLDFIVANEGFDNIKIFFQSCN